MQSVLLMDVKDHHIQHAIHNGGLSMKRLFTLIIAGLLALVSAAYLSMAEETGRADGTLKKTLSYDYTHDSNQYNI